MKTIIIMRNCTGKKKTSKTTVNYTNNLDKSTEMTNMKCEDRYDMRRLTKKAASAAIIDTDDADRRGVDYQY